MSTPGRLQRTTDDYRRRLRQQEQQAVQTLEHSYSQVLATIKPALDKLYDDMVNALADGKKIPPSWIYEAGRLEHLKSYIDDQMSHYGLLSKMTVGQLQHQAALLGQEAGLAQLHATKPGGVAWTFGMPSDKAIADIVGVTQAGSPLDDLFSGFGREAANKAGQALVTGVTLGWNPRKTAAFIQDALQISRWRALNLARTEQMRAYRSANLLTFQQNSDVVDSWVWSATLDRATCIVCILMNGTEHSLDEQMETHNQCRCVQLPKTKSWADILGSIGVDASGIEETSIDIPMGIDWFTSQDAQSQKEILGGAKYNAYADGSLDLMDLIGKDYDPDWGGSRYEKSLKQAIGAKKASKYYAGASK